MPVTMTPELEEKIQRRSKRAWRYHRRGEDRNFSRITEVTDRTLKYRLPDGPGHGDDWYGKTKVLVRREKGKVVIETPPRDPLITMDSKYDLSKLNNHTGRVRAFKYTTTEGKSPTRTGTDALTYRVGDIVSVKSADKSKSAVCSYGINLASKDWIKSNSTYSSRRVFACEFEIEDLAVVPGGTDGKFRVFKCEVMEELDPDTFMPLKPPTKFIKEIVPVDGDPLTQSSSARQSARNKKITDRKQKSLEKLEKKMLPAVVEKTKPESPSPSPKAKQEGFLKRFLKGLGF